MKISRDPREFSVCMGLDAMRLCLGIPTRNFTRDEVVAWIDAMQSVSGTPHIARKRENT